MNEQNQTSLNEQEEQANTNESIELGSNQEASNTSNEAVTENVVETIQSATEAELDKFDTYDEYEQHLIQKNTQASNTVTPAEQVDTKTQSTQANTVETNQVNTGLNQETTNTNQPNAVTEANVNGVDNVVEVSDEDFRKRVTATFKANSQEYSFQKPEDIIKLMQYGANYHKKMGEIAPYRKALKTLEQHGLLKPDNLNYAIELLQGKPEAIAKLLKDKEVDTYNLPDLEEQPYKANDYLPSDSKVAFEDKLEDIKLLSHGNEVINFVKSLDDDSFYEVYSNVHMLDNLHKHMETGLFKDAMQVLSQEKALGRVPANVKDIDAYAHVAEYLEKSNPTKYTVTATQPKVLGNNLNKPVQVPVVNTAKQSASIPNGTVQQRTNSYSGIDLLMNMADKDLDEFETWEQFLLKNKLDN